MVSFTLFIWGRNDWLVPEDLRPLPWHLRAAFFRIDALFFLLTVNPPLLRALRVLTINGACNPAESIQLLTWRWTQCWCRAGVCCRLLWLLWMVYGLFTSHVDIAFHVVRSTPFRCAKVSPCAFVPLLAPFCPCWHWCLLSCCSPAQTEAAAVCRRRLRRCGCTCGPPCASTQRLPSRWSRSGGYIRCLCRSLARRSPPLHPLLTMMLLLMALVVVAPVLMLLPMETRMAS